MIGVIGGSGIYQVDGLKDATWRKVATPFGDPSDELLFGSIDGAEVVFLPRHGRGHRVPPTHVPYRANIDALKRAGVTDIVSLSAVGSLRGDRPPGTFVVVDQFIDRTFAREKSFFGPGMVAHVSMGHPVCGRIGDTMMSVASQAGVERIVRGGTYIVMEGPQFSTVAESNLYRSWGCDVVGMTNMPEAKLAREAEICYATIAMVTDYDCWHPDHDHVTVDDVVRVLQANGEHARALVRAVVPQLAAARRDAAGAPCSQKCDRALDTALMTANETRDPALVTKLDAVLARVLGSR
ncbi:MAG: S-methyl-5'-thioadenosine phosphorylase [Polyangiaceae bacterium]